MERRFFFASLVSLVAVADEHINATRPTVSLWILELHFCYGRLKSSFSKPPTQCQVWKKAEEQRHREEKGAVIVSEDNIINEGALCAAAVVIIK